MNVVRHRVSLVVPPSQYGDVLFSDGPHNRDKTHLIFQLLKRYLGESGVEIETVNRLSVADADAAVFIDLPGGRRPETIAEQKKSILVVWEPPLHSPFAFEPGVRNLFHKVLTWEDEAVDGAKTLLLKYGQPWPDPSQLLGPDAMLKEKEKLACTISSFKRSNDAGELYSERERVIRWYEENAPDQFDLFGMGWDRRVFHGFLRPLNKVRLIGRATAPSWPLWKGPVERKGVVLRRYRFSYTYENYDRPIGYISEKIFDALFAGCVPIYRGSSNISAYVPEDCYVDAAQFGCISEIHEYISKMSAAEYSLRLNAIDEYVRGYCGVFRAEVWAKTVCGEVLNVLGSDDAVGVGANSETIESVSA